MAKKKSISKMSSSMMNDDEKMLDMKANDHMKSMNCGQPECGDMKMMNQHMSDTMAKEKMPMNSKKSKKHK
jgi:hypothetical protein